MRVVTDQHPAAETALRIDSHQDVLALADFVASAPSVLLHFPKWTDGRAYSQARLLRSRLRYAGEVWAHGEVLLDMLPLLQRCGFDVAQLAPGHAPQWADEAMAQFSGSAPLYQADLISKLPHFGRLGR
jgi:uncharacterized protein (DUF934 family)